MRKLLVLLLTGCMLSDIAFAHWKILNYIPGIKHVIHNRDKHSNSHRRPWIEDRTPAFNKWGEVTGLTITHRQGSEIKERHTCTKIETRPGLNQALDFIFGIRDTRPVEEIPMECRQIPV